MRSTFIVLFLLLASCGPPPPVSPGALVPGSVHIKLFQLQRQYYMAKRNNDEPLACAAVGTLVVLYLQHNWAERYEQWLATRKKECGH